MTPPTTHAAIATRLRAARDELAILQAFARQGIGGGPGEQAMASEFVVPAIQAAHYALERVLRDYGPRLDA